MGTLIKKEIIARIKNGELLRNAYKCPNGEYDVEPASYDLRAGLIIWKYHNPETNTYKIKKKQYNPELPLSKQETITLQPGQVMFVITHEEVIMPKELCGTVYAKNKFSRDGILSLTTGHVDPGVECPIVIRLINLRSIPYTFSLGEPIYTIVFHTLDFESENELCAHNKITLDDTVTRTIATADAAMANALHDFSMTHGFVKKEEFGKLLRHTVLKPTWDWIVIIFAIVGAIAAGIKIYEGIFK